MGLKVADSYFIDPDTGKEIKVLMRYTNSGDSIMQTPHNYFRMKNGIVEKQRDEDLWEEPNTEDPNYWLNNFKQAILNLQLPKRVVKYIWDKIFKQGHGGTMNYTQYLQDGGELELPQVERGLGEQEVKALVLAIIENGDEQAADTLIELLKLDPENGWITDWIVGAKEAAEAGDENAQKFWSLIGPRLEALQQTEQFKCGGKVRAKVKKACGGKKLEKGAKIPVEKKGGCPCQYRRVGGRLQLVDCNGVPVAKNGTILYAKPGDQLSPALASDAVENYMTAKQYSVGEVMDAIGNTIPVYRLWNRYYPSFVKRMDNWQQKLLESNPDFWRTPASAKKTPASQLQELHHLLTAEEIAALQEASRKGVEEYYKTPEGKAADERAKAAVTQTGFGAGKQGTFGGLTYDLALARQKEMQAAKDQGFIVDLGRWGADGKWGSQSRGEWERYQKWKSDQELAALKALNSDLALLKPEVKGLVVETIRPNIKLSKFGNKLNYSKYLQ